MPSQPPGLQLPCSWCETLNRDPGRTNCVNCGGPLPALPAAPGETPTRPPPPAPREVPLAYRRRVLLWKNVGVWIGLMFTIPFCWTLLFPLIGIPIGVIAYRRRATVAATNCWWLFPANIGVFAPAAAGDAWSIARPISLITFCL